jgi:hypothetical protein
MKRTVRRPEEATDRWTQPPRGFGRFLAKSYSAGTEKKALLFDDDVTHSNHSGNSRSGDAQFDAARKFSTAGKNPDGESVGRRRTSIVAREEVTTVTVLTIRLSTK